MNATNVKVIRRVDKDGWVEDFDTLLKRFRKAYQESGVLSDIRRHEYYRGPSQKRREKRLLAEKTRRREMQKRNFYESRYEED